MGTAQEGRLDLQEVDMLPDGERFVRSSLAFYGHGSCTQRPARWIGARQAPLNAPVAGHGRAEEGAHTPGDWRCPLKVPAYRGW
jgi:hypothetical protein